MNNLAAEFDLEDPETAQEWPLNPDGPLRLLKSAEHTLYIFFRHQLFAQYQHNDNYSRNLILVQLFLCHKVPQKQLSAVFGLTVPHLSSLVGHYRRAGSAGIEDHTRVRIHNNQKIKGKIANAISKQLKLNEADRPSYGALSKAIKKRYGVSLSRQRIGSWWREQQSEKSEGEKAQADPEQFLLNSTQDQNQEEIESEPQKVERNDSENSRLVGARWQPNNVAGSFVLYAMLEKSQFLEPFLKHLQHAAQAGSKSVGRVLLTLFFMHALRLKSIEQTKHILSAHFGPLVLGHFCRQQSLRYAIDDITAHKRFDKAVKQHYQNISEQAEQGDGVYYTDGHFSCYYGKYKIPKGYDARRDRKSTRLNSSHTDISRMPSSA